NSDRAQLQMANGPEQAIVPGASHGQVQVPNRGAQAQQQGGGPGQAQKPPQKGQAKQDAPKAPVIDRSASLREEINDDDIDDI
ncbi:MAG: hypothetical protein IJT24_03585, partial [Lachnospiraceae bacterium]|nr:hypothetical protein [Lachnospiraceae bacterium]